MQISVTGFDSRPRAKKRQQLNQAQLIEQIVLEPEHQLVIGILAIDGVAPALQIGRDIRGPLGVTGQKARANLEQFVVGNVAWNRPLVERIGPDSCRPARPANSIRRVVSCPFAT